MFGGRFAEGVELSYKIEAELFAGAKVSRVFFKGVSNTSHNHEVSGTVALQLFDEERDNSNALRRKEHIVYINVSTLVLLQCIGSVLVHLHAYCVHQCDCTRAAAGLGGSVDWHCAFQHCGRGVKLCITGFSAVSLVVARWLSQSNPASIHPQKFEVRNSKLIQ